MPMGYGGCYVIQSLPNNTYRVINMSWHVFKKQNYDLCFWLKSPKYTKCIPTLWKSHNNLCWKELIIYNDHSVLDSYIWRQRTGNWSAWKRPWLDSKSKFACQISKKCGYLLKWFKYLEYYWEWFCDSIEMQTAFNFWRDSQFYKFVYKILLSKLYLFEK